MNPSASVPFRDVRTTRWARMGAAAATLAIAATLALVARSTRPAAPLPHFGRVPSFALTAQSNEPFSTASMLGHVSVVDFVFTRCTSSCPRLTARMGEVQRYLASSGLPASDVRLVSFSVDPDNDTPPVLAEYASKAHADRARWTFVTGAADDVMKAVVLGFKVSAARVAKGADDQEVVHGDWFVLVDRAGDIRGYYPTAEDAEMKTLVADVTRLAREKR